MNPDTKKLKIKSQPNPAVERTGREAALFMGCSKLHALGSGHFPWSASPSLLLQGLPQIFNRCCVFISSPLPYLI